MSYLSKMDPEILKVKIAFYTPINPTNLQLKPTLETIYKYS
jgi:hypothetical protein